MALTHDFCESGAEARRLTACALTTPSSPAAVRDRAPRFASIAVMLHTPERSGTVRRGRETRGPTNLDTMPDIFGVIADATRRDILCVLLERHQQDAEMSVSEIVGQLEISQPTVSKHLKVLREVGLVEVRDEGRQRVYRLNGRPLQPIHDWVREYERTWNERFDSLDQVLEELKKKEEGNGNSGK